MTQVSWTKQLGLAIMLFVLGMGAYWLEFKHKPTQEASEEQAKHLFRLSEKEQDLPVQSISFRQNNQQIELTCADLGSQLCKKGDNSKWEITAPAKMKADDSNVNNLLGSLSSLTSPETIDLSAETDAKKTALIKEYGLDPESRKLGYQLTVKTASQVTTLHLGFLHPLGETLFAMEGSNENRIYLIPAHFKTNLDHPLSYWRDKNLLALNAHEVESIQLETRNPGSSAPTLNAQRKDGRWTLHSGGNEYPGDSENIDALLTTLSFLKAKEFASDAKRSAQALSLLKGFEETLKITLQKSQGTTAEKPAPIVLSFFRKKGSSGPTQKVFATASQLDPLFELDANSLTQLNKGLKDFRLTKLMTSADRFSAKRLELSGPSFGKDAWILTNQQGKWGKADAVSEPTATAAFLNSKVQDLLEKLSGNKIKEFVPEAQAPSGDKEALHLTLGDDKDEKKNQWVFWKKDKKIYAKDLKTSRREVFVIDSSMETILPWNKDFFQSPESKGTPPLDAKKE